MSDFKRGFYQSLGDKTALLCVSVGVLILLPALWIIWIWGLMPFIADRMMK